jgi:outer membrane immunogenic protein
MKRTVFGGIAAIALGAALAGPAAAADLSNRYQPIAKAPAYAPPLYSWTGFYLGLNGGGGWGRSKWDRADTPSLSGGVIGGTAGYNWQMGQVVLGAEGDLDWSGLKGTTNTACPAGCTTSNTWLGTVRGRLGYAFDRFLPYVTGGLAVGDIRAATPGFAGAAQTNAGWTLGGGVEFAIAGGFSAKAEYLHVDLGNFNCGLSCGVTATDNVSFSADLLRGGLNYRF